jgi:hypothetical protein
VSSRREVKSRVKGFVREGLRSVGPSPEIVVGLAQTRSDVDRLIEQVGELTDALGSFTAGVNGESDTAFLQLELQRLSQNMSGVLDRLHAHQEILEQVQWALERFGGSILEYAALERRLAAIEDHLAIDREREPHKA